MVSRFPPELVAAGRALRSAFPRQGDRWSATEEARWALEDLMAEVLKDVSRSDARYVKGSFADKTDFDYLTLHHHSYTGLAWPLERRDPSRSYHMHAARNKFARAAQTEEDWAAIWDRPLHPEKGLDLSANLSSASTVLELLQDPAFLKALRKTASDNKKARLEEARAIAQGDQEDREKAARREWAKADRARQKSEKEGTSTPNDFFVQASTRLARFPMEMTIIETMAQYMNPYMRGKLLKLADEVIAEVKGTMVAVKDIDKIAALKARAAASGFEAEAATAQAHADRLANGRARTQYGVHVNLSSDQGNQTRTELPSSSGKKAKPSS